ncbi:MAG TPA: MarR family transcriptional regulator [Candidatus Dormibacteraeota bacterium]|nr:MarR family transcriptional regulator [Candidatus Dormibacteraeota bacterium]
MPTISAPVTHQLETKAALLAYLDALALAEPVQAQLWQRARLTLTQASVLRKLRSGPQTAGKLGELAGLSAASISRLVDRLERRGLVSRRRDTHDRRMVEVHLEPAGERLLGEVKVFKGSDVHRAVEAMSSDERRRLTASLTRLVELTRDIAVQRESRE